MKVLVACEFSGIVRDSFDKLGFDSWSCDIEPSEVPGKHIRGDVRNVLNEGWDVMIAHPPCDYIAHSGVQWLHTEDGRWSKMIDGCCFFRELMNAHIKHIAIENPIIHGYATKIIGRKYDQKIQPWQFGHGEKKSICLWLKNLPKLEPTNVVDGRLAKIHKMGQSKSRKKERSRFFKGVADAMAEQWGNYVRNQA
jgi:hypothetical protein